MDITFTDPNDRNPTQSLFSNYRTGFDINASVGAVFCGNWRFEIEGSYRAFNGKHVLLTALQAQLCTERGGGSPAGLYITGAYNPSTHYRIFSLMVNGFYDFCICELMTWYVGGGIGPSWVRYKLNPIQLPFTASSAAGAFSFC